MNTVTIKKQTSIPAVDTGNLLAGIKKLFRRKSGLEKALDDVRKGRVYHAKDHADLFRHLGI
ncbi:MAG: hypothetical protein LBG17_03345 [Bacteroidales bacterium]|jgi:hypothetical protein|nr:hypothetical protein [Bacteroidales bacterium]